MICIYSGIIRYIFFLIFNIWYENITFSDILFMRETIL